MAVYKIRQSDGTTSFSDKPPAAGQGEIVEVNGRPARPAEPPRKTAAEKDADTAKDLIGATRKYVPKTDEYLNMLDYLRNHRRTAEFNKLLEEIQKTNPKVWLKLQKSPEYRPMTKMLGVIPAGSNILGTAVGAAAGSPGGAAQKYVESTVKDMMKADRYYADVLGAKAPMTAPKTIKYSSPGLTSHMDVQGPKTAKALEGSAKAVADARLGVTEAHANSIGRVGGTYMDFMAWLLQAKTAGEIGAVVVDNKYQDLRKRGLMDEDQEIQYNRYISGGNFKDALKLLDKVEMDYIMSRKP